MDTSPALSTTATLMENELKSRLCFYCSKPVWERVYTSDHGIINLCFRHAASLDKAEREKPKAGRNDPCPCGSGKKYKRCCIRSLPEGIE